MGRDTALTIALLMPTLNEIEGLRHVFPSIDRSLFDKILIVDGGSTDGTLEFAREHGIEVVTQRRRGVSFAQYDAILAMEADYVVLFSPDGNCLPERLPALVEKLREGFDMVVVSRYLPPARSYDDSLVTHFGNFMFSLMIRGLGRFPITDSLNIYRGFRTELLRHPLFDLLLQGPVFEPLLSGLSTMTGRRLAEIPGDEPARIGGASKMHALYNGSCILRMVGRLYWQKLTGRSA